MRFFIAFTISLLLYLFFLWIFLTQFPEMNMPPKKVNNHVVKIDIVNMPIPKKVTPPIKQVPPVSSVKPKPVIKKIEKKKKVLKKKSIPKKIIKKPIKKQPIVKKIVKPKVMKEEVFVPIEVEEEYVEEIVYTEPIVEQEVIPEVIEAQIYEPIEQEYVKEFVEEERVSEPFVPEEREVAQEVSVPVVPNASSDDLASFFKTPDSFSSAPSVGTFPNKKIEKLYGSDFHAFTATQKKFIENNLDKIQNITQRVLTRRGYPEGAGINGQEGTNVVSFNLHPNGDISNLFLKKSIGSRPLDDNTLELIRTAYKDYPYPTSITRLVFYVEYSIYGY